MPKTKPEKFGEETVSFSVRIPKSRKQQAIKAIHKALEQFKPKEK